MRQSANEIKRIGDQGQKTNALLGGMKWSFGANALGVMIQDMTTVHSMGGSLNQVINAGANNAIFFASNLHPIAGAITAAGIAAFQLTGALSGSAAEARKMKEDAEATKRALEGTVNSYISGAGRGANVKDQREADAIAGKMGERIKELEARLAAVDALKPVTAEDAVLKAGKWNRENQALHEARMELALFREATKGLPAKLGLTEQEIPLVERTNDAKQAIRVLRGEVTALEAEMEKLRTMPGVDPKFVNDLEDALTDLRLEQMEPEANRILAEARRQEEQWKADMERQKRESAQAVRDMIMTPRERFDKEANRLSFLGLNRNEMTRALMRDAQQAFGGGPQLAAAQVKGSIEEASSRNRMEAETRNKQAVKAMVDSAVDKIIRAMERINEKNPPITVAK